jgi:hypothetical protein
MQVPPIELILACPARRSNDQTGNLFGGKLFRINDDVEIAPVIDVNAIDLEISFSVLLIALQRSIKNRLVTRMFVRLALKNPLSPGLQWCVQPNSQVRLNQPSCQSGSDHHTGAQRSAH